MSSNALSACTGPIHAGERSPAWSLFAQAGPSTVFVGDGNFGVYGVVERALHHRLDVIFRLTDARASALLAGRRKPFSGRQTPVWWPPFKWDKPRPQATPFALPGRALSRLLRGDGSRDIPPWLFTTLPDIPAYSVDEAVACYGCRRHGELDFRHLKPEPGWG